jgi:hypothetical protein
MAGATARWHLILSSTPQLALSASTSQMQRRGLLQLAVAMDSLNLRIRIDRAIAEKAMQMAHARGVELPDVIRCTAMRK